MATRVDRQSGSCAVKNADGGYGVSPNTNVALVPGIARSLDDVGMANDDIESLWLERKLNATSGNIQAIVQDLAACARLSHLSVGMALGFGLRR